MARGGATPKGLAAWLRHHAGPLLPSLVRNLGSRFLTSVESRRGGTYEIVGQRIRFLHGSAPTVLSATSDERATLDAAQLSRFANAIHPGDIVADVGAYRGTYTLVAASCAGTSGHVFAFEPTRANAEAIAANVRLNAFDKRVTIEQAAVSDREGTASFFAWGDATTNSLAQQQSESKAVEIRTITLDGYFTGRLPDIVKIDIEGAELLALRGASRILASDAYIICELHPYAWKDFGHTGDDLQTLLRHYNRYAADLTSGAEIRDYRYGVVVLAKRD